MPELTPLQQCALAGAIPPKTLQQAKRALRPGSEHVDFLVRISADVTRQPDTPDGSGECPASVCLTGPRALNAILTQLGVGPERLSKAVLEVVADAIARGHSLGIGEDAFSDDTTRSGVLTRIAAEVAASLPPVTYQTTGKTGGVTVQGTATLVDLVAKSSTSQPSRKARKTASKTVPLQRTAALAPAKKATRKKAA